MLKSKVPLNHSCERNGIMIYFLKRKYKSQLNDIPTRVYLYMDFVYIEKELENGYIALIQKIAEITQIF